MWPPTLLHATPPAALPPLLCMHSLAYTSHSLPHLTPGQSCPYMPCGLILRPIFLVAANAANCLVPRLRAHSPLSLSLPFRLLSHGATFFQLPNNKKGKGELASFCLQPETFAAGGLTRNSQSGREGKGEVGGSLRCISHVLAINISLVASCHSVSHKYLAKA